MCELCAHYVILVIMSYRFGPLLMTSACMHLKKINCYKTCMIARVCMHGYDFLTLGQYCVFGLLDYPN